MTRLFSFLAALVLTSSAVNASPIMPLLTSGADLTDPLDVASDLLSATPQVIPSSSILLGSTTNIMPFTGVYPHLEYQPSIELNGPIVQDFTPFSPYFGIGGYSGYGLGSLGGSSLGLFKRQLGSPLGAGLGGAFLGPTVGGGPIGGGGFGGPGGPLGGGGGLIGGGFGGAGGARGPVGGGGPMGAVGGGSLIGTTNNFAGAPSGTATDTLIKTLVSITPHALEPIPYPVSTFYDYPVPVGVPTPVPTPVATGFGRGKFGFDRLGCGGGFGCDDFGFGIGGFDGFGFDDFGLDGFDF